VDGQKELVRRAKKGDIYAFEDLIAGYQKRVYNTVYRFFNNHEDAMDITQEIFIKVFTSLNRFKGNYSFSTWLYRIAVNTCIDFSRQKRPDTLPIMEELGANDEMHIVTSYPDLPEKALEKKEFRRDIEEAINNLPEEQRICIILRDIQGFSYIEISDILSCSLGTVKSRINRGRRVLRQYLKQKELFLENDV